MTIKYIGDGIEIDHGDRDISAAERGNVIEMGIGENYLGAQGYERWAEIDLTREEADALGHWLPRRVPLFQFGWFASHAGFQLPWKFDADALSGDDIEALARLIRWKFAFSGIYGVPRGGERLADTLRPHVEPGYPMLIVDDVLTTGRSMIKARERHLSLFPEVPVIGVVILARGQCPDWVWPILSVNEWAQSRATGLG